jgi:hypothetical protein
VVEHYLDTVGVRGSNPLSRILLKILPTSYFRRILSKNLGQKFGFLPLASGCNRCLKCHRMGTTDTVKQEAVRLQNTKAELPPIANPMQPPDVRSFGVYHQRGNYFIPRSKGGWYPGNLEAAKDYIVKNYGIRRDKVRTGDSLTQINDVMVSVRDLNSVVWAGSCGCMPPQLISVNGTDILILDGPKLIAPMKGDFQIINYILLNLLGVEQLEYFNGWMKWGHENLLKVYGGKEGRLGVSKTATLVQETPARPSKFAASGSQNPQCLISSAQA